MPLNSSKRKRSNTRTAAHAVLLAAFALLAASALFGVGASAQRAKNDNASQQQQGRSSRRVIVGRGSETSSGSRTTITADDSLNDYSAYRSGDRFVVVLPKSAAGAVAKGSGKGYSDVQVQQRGDSVVVSYKVQPGAKPRVEQKFNRLDVVFDVKEGAQPTASGQQTPTQQPAENRNPNATAQQQQQQQQQQSRTSETPANPNDRRANEAASNTTQPGALTPANNAAQTGQPATQTEAAQTQTTPAAVEQTPSTAPTAEPQIAQNQQPAPIAPITKTDNAAANAQVGVSFGAMLARNWPIPLFVALLVIGLGLVFFTRRSAGNAPEVETVATATTTKLEEPRAVSLKEAKAEPVAVADVVAKRPAPIVEAKPAPVAEEKPEPIAEVKPLVAPVVVPTDKADRRRKKKQRKGKVRGGRVEDLPLAASESVEEPSLESLVAAVPEPSAEVNEPPAEEPTLEVAAPSVEETPAEAPVPSVEEPVVEETLVAEPSTPTVEAVAEVEAPRETSLEPSVETAVAAVEASTVEPVTESAVEPVSESAAHTVTSIAPASAPDPEDVQVATRRLLEGQSYERSVIGSEDSMARQLIGAELLSALAGRNAERRERARAAFVEHGYFDEKARDVRDAAAPAERAAAARSLAIVGERSAAPHLISALEDDSMEVRRAAVEALGALREPTAVEPLEALLQREKSQRNRIPNRIIQHAIETCRLAAAEELMPRVEEAAHAEESSAREPELATHEVEAAHVEEVAARETGIAPVPEEEEAPEVEEVTLISEPAQTVETSRPSVEPTLFETQPEVAEIQPVVEAQVDAGSAPVAELQPVEEPWLIEETQPVEEAQAVEEPSHAGEVPALEESGLELLPEGASTPVAESNAVEPFIDAPQTFESPAAGPQAGEWVEFDVNDIGSAESATPATPSEPVFELSSGETMQAEPVAEAEPQTLEVELPAPEAFESMQAFEPITVEATPQVSPVEFESGDVAESAVETAVEPTDAEAVTAPLPDLDEKGVMPFDERSIVPAAIQQRLTSREASVRAAAITELSHLDTDEAFQQICSAFDDESKEVRSAAARALYELRTDRAESFTRALREANPDRRRNIGAAVSTSGLASEAISQLTGESRDRTYEAFSLLFLMAKAGEVQPLVRAIEGHPNNEVRLAVVKLLALSGQKEILPAFRRLAVRGSLPTEVRSAVMEAIYQISSSQPTTV